VRGALINATICDGLQQAAFSCSTPTVKAFWLKTQAAIPQTYETEGVLSVFYETEGSVSLGERQFGEALFGLLGPFGVGVIPADFL